MITLVTKSVVLFMSMAMVFVTNPVKLSMWLLIVSMMMFFLLTLSSGGVWFPMLFSLIFMGGILMMFMILSSILPNEKSLKLKIFPLMCLVTISLTIFNRKQLEVSYAYANMKSFLSTSSTMLVLIMMLALYFFAVMSILCKEEMPMRTILCCGKKLIL